jgi:hypothetical protein
MVLQYMKEETLPCALMQDVLLPDQRAIFPIKTKLFITTGSLRSPKHNRVTE